MSFVSDSSMISCKTMRGARLGFLKQLLGNRKQPQNEPTKRTAKLTIEMNVSCNQEIPPYQGDYAKTLFLNACSKVSPLRKKLDYQRYLLYECGITDPVAFHKKLISEGLLREASIPEKIAKLNIPEIKAILLDLGLPVSGKKEELIQRVVDSGNEAVVRKHCTEVTYTASEKGLDFLKEHNDYILIHNHKDWGIDWQEYDKRKRPELSFNDYAWGLFNERIMKSQNFGRNEYLCMYRLLVEEEKRTRALAMLLSIIHIDLSGTNGFHYLFPYKKGSGMFSRKEIEDMFCSAITLAPGILSEVPKYKDIFDDSYIEKAYEHKLPIEICDKIVFTSIIHSLLDCNF